MRYTAGLNHDLSASLGRLEMTPMPGLRMVCLHGYHGSAAILHRQMAPLAASVLSDAELVYVDAPR
jgi:Serine hydrolase (FSH1)